MRTILYILFTSLCLIGKGQSYWPLYTSVNGLNPYVSSGVDHYVNNPASPSATHIYNVSVTGETIPMQVTNRNVERLWDAGITGAGVRVFVIDDGFSNYSDITIKGGICSSNTDSPYFVVGGSHGAEICSVIADKRSGADGNVGIAYGCDLYVVRAVNSPGGKPYKSISNPIDAAIQYCIDSNANIINMSFSADINLSYLDDAIRRGIIIVAAAGNRNIDLSVQPVMFPASHPGVVAVGSRKGGHVFVESDTLGHNNVTPVNGKGIDFLSEPWIIVKKPYGYSADFGTSLSSPVVASYFALLLQWARERGIIMKPYQWADYMRKFTASTYQGYRRFTTFNTLKIN